VNQEFRTYTVDHFLAAVAAREPAPGGGAVAAISVASAAGLVAMAARYSKEMADAETIAAEGDELRVDAVRLADADADADADAYGAVLTAYRRPSGDDGRQEGIREALHRAAEVPGRIAAAGARVAELAADVAKRGNPNLVGDAHAAVLVAEAGARVAANLVRINVELGGLDPVLTAAAQAHVADAAGASRVIAAQ
jgi:formiminotetrahydrofolate cyclodeaminase